MQTIQDTTPYQIAAYSVMGVVYGAYVLSLWLRSRSVRAQLDRAATRDADRA